MTKPRIHLSDDDRAALAAHLRAGLRERCTTFAEWAWEFALLGPNVCHRVLFNSAALAAPAVLRHDDPDRFISEALGRLNLASALQSLGAFPWGSPEHSAALARLEAKLSELHLLVEETPGDVELIERRESMYAGVCCVRSALAASCWKEDWVPRDFDPVEYQARVAAGPAEEVSTCLSLACLASGFDREQLIEAFEGLVVG